jgi:hypothetical protein
MSNVRIERPNTVIKVTVSPVSSVLKAKVSTAIQSVVNAIKAKHLQ